MSIPSTDDLARYVLSLTGRPLSWHVRGPKGYWRPDIGKISIRLNMSEAQTRSSLAHEIAHAESGHPCGNDSVIESAAHRRAAEMLISATKYAEAEEIYSADIARIAEELTVTIYHATIWRDSYARIAAM